MLPLTLPSFRGFSFAANICPFKLFTTNYCPPPLPLLDFVNYAFLSIYYGAKLVIWGCFMLGLLWPNCGVENGMYIWRLLLVLLLPELWISLETNCCCYPAELLVVAPPLLFCLWCFVTIGVMDCCYCWFCCCYIYYATRLLIPEDLNCLL